MKETTSLATQRMVFGILFFDRKLGCCFGG